MPLCSSMAVIYKKSCGWSGLSGLWAGYVGNCSRKDESISELYLVENRVLKAGWLEKKPKYERKCERQYKLRLCLWSLYIHIYEKSEEWTKEFLKVLSSTNILFSISFLLVPSHSVIKMNGNIPPSKVEIIAFWNLSKCYSSHGLHSTSGQAQPKF